MINTYFGSVLRGLRLTLRHIFQKKYRKILSITHSQYFTQAMDTTTIQYPAQKMPVPLQGRYQLHVEIDDCIVCDLCAKICPVDCIDIISVKATEEIGITSDGTKKRLYPALFDIDMAKCMYCGLCTVVCPTECIIMTDEYDRSFAVMTDMLYKFSEMTEQEVEQKKKELELFQFEKEIAKKQMAAKQEQLNAGK